MTKLTLPPKLTPEQRATILGDISLAMECSRRLTLPPKTPRPQASPPAAPAPDPATKLQREHLRRCLLHWLETTHANLMSLELLIQLSGFSEELIRHHVRGVGQNNVFICQDSIEGGLK